MTTMKERQRRCYRKFVVCLLGFLLCLPLVSFVSISQGEDVKEVRVGVILPLSGPVSATGNRFMNMYEFTFNEVNAAGGIKSLGGAKLKLLKGDSESKSDVGMTAAEKLINEGAVVLMGAFQSDVTFVASQVAENRKTPFICETSASERIASRGFKYLFKISPDFPTFIRCWYKYFDDYGKKTGVKAKRIALINENTLFGKSNYESFQNLLPKDYELMVEFFPRGTPDLTSELTKIKAWKPDIIHHCGYVDDAVLIRRTMREINLKPMIYISAPAGQDPKYTKTLGDLAEFTVINGEWAPDIKKAGVAEVNAKYKKVYGEDMFAQQGEVYAAIYVLKDALERAASIDKEKVRKALSETRLTNHLLPRRVIRFDEAGKDPDATSMALQIIQGKYYTIWPSEFASKEGVWPGKY